MIRGLGNVAIKNLLEQFKKPEGIFKASLTDLMHAGNIRKEIAQNIVNKIYSNDPADEIKKAERLNVRIITFTDPVYPSALKEIYDPPMILYVLGNDITANRVFIGMVGSRNATHYGVGSAEKLAQGLARRGLGIVSGMAKGIDSSAHWGCLAGKGFTIAVLGTGIDIVYPSSNRTLYQKIIKHGAVISEFPIGTTPVPGNFPLRNRVISGLCRGIVVVEATKNSGSLITASLALDQGREVFAVPGSINSFKSTGCHMLIKQGAKLIENSDDILDELGLNFRHVSKKDSFKQESLLPMGQSEKDIYEIIGDYPMHIDDIAENKGLSPREVASILMRMELKGIIRQLPGKMFIR